MKIKFREIRMSKANLKRLELVNAIIGEYQADGYVLTLRQLYYQLVSRDVIPNKGSEYAKLSKLLKEGRMSGVVDWDAIEDRLRVPYTPSSFDSPEDVLDAVVQQYKLPRMNGQDVYIEVWVEKDALSGVLRRVTGEYHVPILVNRGYSSASAMYDSFERFRRNGILNGKPVKILYLGDYDPSGLDMIRDIRERTMEFVMGYTGATYEDDFEFDVLPIALTRSQIDQYDPPPNPAKITDPRAKDFIRKYGNTSWEVDALRPEILNQLLRDAILEFIDVDKYENILEQEKADREKLNNLRNLL